MIKIQAKKIFDFVTGTMYRLKEQDQLSAEEKSRQIEHKRQEEQGRIDALYIVQNFETDVTATQVMSWSSSDRKISNFIFAWGYYRNAANTCWISEEKIERQRKERYRERQTKTQEIRMKGPS